MISDLSYTGGTCARIHKSQLGKLVKRHQPQILRLARKFAQAPFTPEEFAKEGAATLWEATSLFRGDPVVDEDEFSAYVEKAIRNRLARIKRDYFRKERAKQRLEESGELALDDEFEGRIREGCGVDYKVNPSPRRAAFAKEAAAEVRDAVEKLDSRQRTVIKGRYFDEKRLKDVAAEIGISAGAAGVYESRALKKLRDIIPDDLDPTNFREE